MLLSTRNFMLYLLLVAFLLCGITYTVLEHEHDQSDQSAAVLTALPEEAGEPVYTVGDAPTVGPDRAQRLKELRDKLLTYALPEAPEPASVPVIDESTESIAPIASVIPQEELRCVNFKPSQINWLVEGLQFSVVEGARLLYREVASVAGGSTSTDLGLERLVVWQLPLQSQPADTPSCLDSDVIGVAKDGSLIRNNETALYQVFDGDTLIGYARDGFPIYGARTDLKLDQCGGMVVEGQYRYHVNAELPHLLDCFAGTPITIE